MAAVFVWYYLSYIRCAHRPPLGLHDELLLCYDCDLGALSHGAAAARTVCVRASSTISDACKCWSSSDPGEARLPTDLEPWRWRIMRIMTLVEDERWTVVCFFLVSDARVG